ncbi:WYL domain-containing protein [Streptosporangiaceae bacterium NEAU-GS5]|nr:WYL domain-containing protein [Streptosporangiaceae bacterium NEAU-GS5]
MKRPERLTAIVAELEARAPGAVSARRLGERLGVSKTTIVRDVGELQRSGVPIVVDAGGYALGGFEAVKRAIDQALAGRFVLRVDYLSTKGVRTTRDVEPSICLGGRGGHWYLVAWCRLREDVRVFRLDRIMGAEVTDERFPEPGRERLEELAGIVGGGL